MPEIEALKVDTLTVGHPVVPVTTLLSARNFPNPVYPYGIYFKYQTNTPVYPR